MLQMIHCLKYNLNSNTFLIRFTVNYEEESLESPVIVTKSCGPLNFTLMLIGIVYAGLLLLVSSILGWGCRKLPDNFKVCALPSLNFLKLLINSYNYI